MAYLTFDAGRGSQEGLDMAAALRAQRMAALQQGQNADLMYRRDPRAAAALIAAQMQAENERLGMQQRGDIARDEQAYRREALAMQGQESAADREASMNRLLATVGAQRGMAGERMDFDREQADAARRAAIAEASAQREFQRGLAGKQLEATTSEGQKAREHATTLANLEALNRIGLAAIEQGGMDRRSMQDFTTKMMELRANLAAEAGQPNYALIKAEFDKAMAAYPAGGTSATPPPTPAPKTAAAKLAADEPELTSAWMAAMGGTNDTPRKNPRDFLLHIPTEDIKNNAAALERFLSANYDTTPEDALWSNFGSLETRKAVEARRRALGLKPMNPNLIWRLFGVHGTEGKDSTYGFGF